MVATNRNPPRPNHAEILRRGAARVAAHQRYIRNRTPEEAARDAIIDERDRQDDLAYIAAHPEVNTEVGEFTLDQLRERYAMGIDSTGQKRPAATRRIA